MRAKKLVPKGIEKRSDSEIVALIRRKVEKERVATIEVLHLLQAVESRRIHLKMAFSSLHEFCVHELKYTDGASFRRIRAMRLMREVPEVERKLSSGTLSLSNAATVQGYFTENPGLTLNEKIGVISDFENKSTREAEKMVQTLLGKTPTIKIEIDTETYDLLKELQKCLSHKKEAQSLNTLVKNLVRSELIQQTQRRFGQSQVESGKPSSCFPNGRDGAVGADASRTKKTGDAAHLGPAKLPPTAKAGVKPSARKQRSRHIPARIRRMVFRRDRSCTYVDPVTRRRCGSQWQLEVDHIKLFSEGGTHELDNLRLRCDAHNRFSASAAC